MKTNRDNEVVSGFGDEWSRFDQSEMTPKDHQKMFDDYFHRFPWEKLTKDAIGFDLGCGSGRWAKLVAPRVAKLYCIDASEEALEVAKKNLTSQKNCEFHVASVEDIPLEDASADFGYTLGVLHHVPDTQAGLISCVSKLKQGAPFLLYLYYRFDQRPWWFKALWKTSEIARRFISKMPHSVRYFLSQVIAATVYFPLSRFALLAEKLGVNVENFPLNYYRHTGFYVLRTDALDRFGTQLEQRFTQEEIRQIMLNSGLDNITFNDNAPFWCALGYKR